MVLILNCQCHVTVSIYSVVTIRTRRRISNKTEVRCTSALFLNFVTNCFQLVFRCCTARCNCRVINTPILIIKTSYIVAHISRSCTIGLFTHRYSASFHSFRCRNSGNVKVFLQFKTDLRIVTGLRDFRRNIVVAVYCYLGS